jgi:sugar O-acyltransferase (sialic acid O-acetyltransferase NeuD family)
MRIIVIGAGGHGQVVADVLQRMRDAGAESIVAGYLDDDPALMGSALLGVPVLGPVRDLSSVSHDAVIVAVGRNQTRMRLAEDLKRSGERFAVARHPSAVIAPDVVIGPGSMICAGVIVNPGTTIGAHAILNTGSTIDHHNGIGDYAHIGPGAHLGGNVRIGMGTLIGIGSTVLPQRQVGEWSVIGAGSVVIKDVPSGVTAIGAPATVR